jgi:argininosuccinate lyase
MLVTDFANYLVLKRVRFHQARHIAGVIIWKAEERSISIVEFSLEDLR